MGIGSPGVDGHVYSWSDPWRKSVGETGRQQKGFQQGTINEILEASVDRLQPACPVYGVCGGCQFQHLKYEAQLIQKGNLLHDTLSRLGKFTVDEARPVVGSPDAYQYRNSVRFAVCPGQSGFFLGFRQEGNHRTVEASGCPLVLEAMKPMVSAVAERLAGQSVLPVHVHSLEIRHSTTLGSTLLVFRGDSTHKAGARSLFRLFQGVPGVVGQVLISNTPNRSSGAHGQRWVEGQDHIIERFDRLLFRISDRSFMQVNWHIYKMIFRTVVEWIGSLEGMKILELYAGVGTLGLPLARRGALVTEVEANPFALANARKSAAMNHIGRCRFRALRTETLLAAVEPGEYDLVLMDPPRAGLSAECVRELARIQVPRLLYLSCDAPSLARDLGRLRLSGYRIARLQPFDMFPQTAHLETLVELVR